MEPMVHRFSSADQKLAARLEAAEAANLAALARAAAGSLSPISFKPFAGGVAVFAGVGSPMTHAVGIGTQGAIAEEEMARMEQFFQNHGSACIIDFCPLADPSVTVYLQNHPYRVIEFNNVMARRIEPDERFESANGVRLVPDTELRAWAQVIAAGFSEHMEVPDETIQVMTATLGESQCWSAGETWVGGGAMGIQNGVALFYGDATLPSDRRKGWQTGLIRARLSSAQKQNCDLAAASVLPGSVSHRNYERAGFQLIYMRVILMREFA